MRKTRLKVWIGLGAIVIAALIIFGSVNLYQKFNEVGDLKGQLAEQAPQDQNTKLNSGEKKPIVNPDKEESNTDAGESQSRETGAEAESAEHTDRNVNSGSKDLPSNDDAQSVQAIQEQETKQEDNADKDKEKKAIDATITADMKQLQSSCVAVSNRLSKQIAEEIQADNDATIKSISSKYLPSILEAEIECDNKFQKILDKAVKGYETAGLAVESMPQWKKQYEAAKQQARAKALKSITSS